MLCIAACIAVCVSVWKCVPYVFAVLTIPAARGM